MPNLTTEERSALTELHRKRGIIQSQITRLKNTIQNPSQDADHDVAYLMVMFEQVTKHWERFNDIQDSIEKLDPSEEEKRFELQEAYCLLNVQINKRKITVEAQGTPSISQSPITVQTNQLSTASLIKLPDIPLPKFDGAFENWTSFYNSFMSIVNDRDDLNDSQRLQYLKAALIGTASNTIKSLSITEANYHAAIRLLKERYECTRKIIATHWEKLRGLPKVVNNLGLNDFIDNVKQHVEALNNLGEPTEHWNTPLNELILSKIHPNLAEQWEISLTDDTKTPPFTDLLKFIRKRANCKQGYNYNKSPNNQMQGSNHAPIHRNQQAPKQVFVSSPYIPCPVCNEAHPVRRCNKFLAMAVDERKRVIQRSPLCFNCLSPTHTIKDCQSSSCFKCSKRHHTLLHVSRPEDQVKTDNLSAGTTSQRHTTLVVNPSTNHLMVTAVVNVFDHQQNPIKCRTLIDTCSTTNFMSEEFAKKLQLPIERCAVEIGGLGTSSTTTNHLITATIRSIDGKYERTLQFLTVPQITQLVPDQPINRAAIKVPRNLKLADPLFHKPAPIDMLLDTAIAFSIMCVGQINISISAEAELYLQKTRLGWVIGGKVPTDQPQPRKRCKLASLNFDMEKFWRIEQIEPTTVEPNDTVTCEQHFIDHVTRDETGRYTVALPFNNNLEKLGESRNRAFNRYKNLEYKFQKNPAFKQAYTENLEEYLKLGHMTKVDQPNKTGYYLPHHAVIKEGMYVDDAVVGTDDRETARQKRDELIAILKSGGFNIRQWASNDQTLLKDLPNESVNLQFQLKDSHTLKTLGVFWNAEDDSIRYTVKLPDPTTRICKRAVLSQIARIFDPLGLLGPVISYAKIFMQKLWGLKLDWDESLPLDLHTEWTQYQMQLQQINQIAFRRHARQPDTKRTELHGFCDASEKAFGACIYLRTIDAEERIKITLLCAKSHVAPRGMARSETIPKLELCGAVMLAKLYTIVTEAIRIPLDATFLWTDATTILHWLHTSPNELVQFVSNRVAIIQAKTNINDWRHVRSEFNPADRLSRGQLPQEFVQDSLLWQHGPRWLQEHEDCWPQLKLTFASGNLVGRKKKICLHAIDITNGILNKGSTMTSLESIVAYCLRFRTENKTKGPLIVEEIEAARRTIFRLLQQHAFAEEIKCIKRNQPINSKSKILKLNPQLDEDGLLRVGGRIKNANLNYNQCHQIIIPKSHRVTTLLIMREHLTNLHAGIQTTLYSLRQNYWIINGRHEVAKVIKTCVKCCRFNPQPINYLMGDLPADRVTPSRPFTKVGIDYAGPLFIKERKNRNRSRVKVYVAIFVCLSVKAVHLELVSDLTSDAFIAALKRFIGRRGKCTDIYSDNGTSFVGARNELRELGQLLVNQQHQTKVHEYTAHSGIRWHFIPARSPNFGGLWEAAVKSFKHHLKRVVGEQLFTFEQLNTFLIEVEAVLNSRPITPISSDPTDLQALTPGHFLTGGPLTNLPEQDLRNVTASRLSTWQHIQRVRQHFWTRWQREYLTELTVRTKWTQGNPELSIGRLVLVKEDNQPPLRWKMGRIIKLHPGSDGIVRVVTIRTATGNVDRNVKKIALLPVQTTTQPHPEDALPPVHHQQPLPTDKGVK